MPTNQIDVLVRTWRTHTQRDQIDDYDRENQMRTLLRELAPTPEYAIVTPMSGGATSFENATWLSHEILVLGDGSLYRFAGMESVSEGDDAPVFTVTGVRVPFDQFKRVQVAEVCRPESGTTKCNRRWDFFEISSQPAVSISLESWIEGWAGSQVDFVHEFARRLGWALPKAS